MNKSPNRPVTIKVLMVISALRIRTVLLGIAWLESYWVANPPRPDCSFNLIILTTLLEIPLMIWLWFPHRFAWVTALLFDLYVASMYHSNLESAMYGLHPSTIPAFIFTLMHISTLIALSTLRYSGVLKTQDNERVKYHRVILLQTFLLGVPLALLAPFILMPFIMWDPSLYYRIAAPLWHLDLTGPYAGVFRFDTVYLTLYPFEFWSQMIPIVVLGTYYVIRFRRIIVFLSTLLTPLMYVIRAFGVTDPFSWWMALPIPTVFLIVNYILLLRPYAEDDRNKTVI